MISIHYEDTEILDLRPEFFISWLSDVSSLHGYKLGEIALVFCSDPYLLDVNIKHLEHDFYTDIITFDYTVDKVVSGDLFVSIDRVRDNAEKLSQLFHVELNRVVVHGLLHLIGFGDKSEEQAVRMRELENEALSLIVSRET